MSQATDLRDAVKRKYSGNASRRLIGLTNMTDDNSDEVIDEDVLLYNCEDALGYFEMETGHSAVVATIAKRKVLVDIVILLLMQAKGTDSSLVKIMKSTVDGQLMSFRRKSRGKMRNNSNLELSEEIDKFSDMDRIRTAFQTKRSARNGIRETNE